MRTGERRDEQDPVDRVLIDPPGRSQISVLEWNRGRGNASHVERLALAKHPGRE